LHLNTDKAFGTNLQAGKMFSFAAFLVIPQRKAVDFSLFLKNKMILCRFSERKGFLSPFFFSKSPRSARPALSKIAIAALGFFTDI